MTSEAVDDASVRDLDSAADFFDRFRDRLFGIAYRLLGSVAEAEDVVQEAWLRWQQTDRSVVRNPSGFLTTVTTRLALNTLDSARARRENDVGSWLPEPVDSSTDPMLGAETAEALEAAVLVVMEKLSPEPRAAYVLREAFRYPYEEIAEILDTTTVNARQMVSRARKHVQSSRSEPVEPGQHKALLDAFVAAARDGDLDRLEKVLAADVVSISDGAGMAPRAARRPVFGRDRVIRFVAGWADWWVGTTLTWIETNGQPSVLVTRGGSALAVLSINVTASGIDRLLWVMAPDKLNLDATDGSAS